jgi:transposase
MTPHKDYCLDSRPSAPTPLLPLSPVLSDALQVCHPHAAGIDIGEAEHWVAVPPGRAPQPVRRFGTFTADLDALADWLIDCGVTTVAMESTGVYWIPLFELLEARGLAVLLIDPRQAKRAPGRPKTDRLDCKWLQRLHAYGLLAAAFRPAAQVCVLRSSLRHRQMLLTYGAHHMQHMHKALQAMNLKLSQVVSDLTSVTGMAILHAIIAGEHDPLTLAKLRNPPCQHSEEEIAKALQGTWRAEHLFALQQAVELYHFYHQQLTVCAQHIQAHLGTFADKSDGQPLPPKPRRPKKVHEPRFDARTPL